MMTDEEKRVLALTADLWNALIAPPDPHGFDNAEHMRDIHCIQNRLLARVAKRTNPEQFRP